MNTSPYQPSQDRPSPAVSWHYMWTMCSRHLWLFFACFVPILLLTIAYLLVAPRLFESTAVVQVEQQEQRAFKAIDKEDDSEDLKGEDVIKTIEQNLQNYSLFVQVVSDPAISSDPRFLVGYPGPVPAAAPELASWLKSHTTVALRHGTRLIDITVDHRVPEMAQKLAQALVDAFVLQSGKAQTSTAQTALKFLVAQSDDVKANLQKSENSLQIYKDSLLLKDRIDDQQRVIDALRQRYREKHPQLIQARMLLADLMQTFDEDFKKVIVNSKSEAAYWASNSNDLASAPPQDRVVTELKLVEARTEVLQKEVDTESALFDNILKQMRETDVNQESAPTEIRLVEPPQLPSKATKPKRMVILVLGLAAALIAGAAAVAGRNALDSSVKTTVEAGELTGLPILGAIPRLPSEQSRLALSAGQAIDAFGPMANELVVLTSPGSAAAEAFRSLRASVSLLGKAREHRTLLFSSSLPGEGKTFISCNYALGLSQVGLKTLLIDTDLRRPAVHTRFHLENKRGLVELITQDLKLSDVVHSAVAKNLDVLTAGSRCPNPAELLSGSGCQDILKDALTVYDRIVLDCSPINMVSDLLLIAPFVDTICFVIRSEKTSRQAVQTALATLRRAEKEPAGIILNALAPWSDRLYLGYHSQDGSAYRQSYA